MRLLVPFGFYGWGNIGDEATLSGFAALLAQSNVRARVSVGSRNPTHTKRVEPAFQYFSPTGKDPRRWWAKLRASAHAVAGGTPIMDVLGAWPLCELAPLVQAVDRWKVPLAFIGVGIEKLRLDESRRIVVEEIAPRVRHWCVRSELDAQRLVGYGVPPDAITVAADMAWLIEPASKDFGRALLQHLNVDWQRPRIGVNLVNENSLFDREPRVVRELASALDELTERLDARIIFLANEVREDAVFDKAAARRVISLMKHPSRAILVPNTYFSPREMMSIVGCCDVTISMRYHFCLFSALQRVPFVAIRRSDKVSDLCWDLGWQANVIPPEFEAGEIIGHATHVINGPTWIADYFKGRVEQMKSRALANVTALNAISETESGLIAGDRMSPVNRGTAPSG